MTTTIYVWDRFVRFFHWALVALFTLSYFSGEEEAWFHPYSGYAIVALVTARIAWGFVGSPYARFASFVAPPRQALAYLKGLLSGQAPQRYLGHNPAGGLMVIAMLLTLALTTFSGLQLYAEKEGKGPFASSAQVAAAARASDDEHRLAAAASPAREHDDDGEEEESVWEEVHEAGVSLMLALIALHLVGVVLSSRAHGESLVRAMLTGRKDSSL